MDSNVIEVAPLEEEGWMIPLSSLYRRTRKVEWTILSFRSKHLGFSYRHWLVCWFTLSPLLSHSYCHRWTFLVLLNIVVVAIWFSLTLLLVSSLVCTLTSDIVPSLVTSCSSLLLMPSLATATTTTSKFLYWQHNWETFKFVSRIQQRFSLWT